MPVQLRWLAMLSGLLLALGALAQETGGKGQTVRPEVGKPLQSAIELLKNKRAREALAKLREAQAVRDKTPYESYLVEREIGRASAAAGDAASAAHAFESAASSSSAGEGDRRQLLAAAASQYYVSKDYHKAAELASRYFKAGGSDKSMRTIHVQALYLANNFAAAAKAVAADIEAEEQAGVPPSEEQLQMLVQATSQMRDAAAYNRALERLVARFPKREYWLSVLHGITTAAGFSERLAVDLARLRLATGTMRGADDYLEAAQLSLQEGFPMEAAKIVDQGYAAGALGAGPEAERHKRLKNMAAKNLAEDKQALATPAAAGKDGKVLFNEGFNYVLNGKPEAGLPMMEDGLRQAGSFRRPEHAKLQLAYAYHLAGKNQKAIQIYKTVQGTDGAAALARLWVIHLARAS